MTNLSAHYRDQKAHRSSTCPPTGVIIPAQSQAPYRGQAIANQKKMVIIFAYDF